MERGHHIDPNQFNSPENRGGFNIERNMDLGIEDFHIHVDRQIQTAQMWAERLMEQGYGLDQIFRHLESARYEIAGQIRTFVGNNFEVYDHKKTLLFRLRFLYDSMEQRLMWPFLALYGRDHQEAKKMRGKLAESMYGLCAIHLEAILGEDGNSELRHTEPQTRGIINELTALALLNRHSSSSRIALLSSFHDDTERKIDIDYLAFNGDPTVVRHHGIQVKSSHNFASHFETSRNGRSTITAVQMDNTYDNRGISYPTARAIIRDLNATADSRDEERIEAVVGQPSLRNILFPQKK